MQNIEEIQTYYAELFHIYQPVYYGKEDNLFANIDEYNDALLHIGSLGLALDAFTEFSKVCIIYLAHYYIESELDKEFDGEKDRESIYIPGMLNQLTRALAFRDADQQHALLNAFDVLFPG